MGLCVSSAVLACLHVASCRALSLSSNSVAQPEGFPRHTPVLVTSSPTTDNHNALSNSTNASSAELLHYTLTLTVQGTMMVLGALSLQLPSFPPGAISLAVLLAPVAFTAHITSLPFIGATKISLAEVRGWRYALFSSRL